VPVADEHNVFEKGRLFYATATLVGSWETVRGTIDLFFPPCRKDAFVTSFRMQRARSVDTTLVSEHRKNWRRSPERRTFSKEAWRDRRANRKRIYRRLAKSLRSGLPRVHLRISSL
jgi:hypothetical protein